MTDLVAQAAAELYAAEPEEFTAHRKRLVAAARTAGDKEAAGRIGELRKPTKAAWLLNRLVREQPEVPVQLAMVSDGLRSAEQERDGARLRELSGARSALVDEFAARALAMIGDPPAGLREDVAGTLEAAIADPAVAADLSAGTLTRAARWAGFGLGAGLAPVPADGPADGDEPADVENASEGLAPDGSGVTRAGRSGPARSRVPAPTVGKSKTGAALSGVPAARKEPAEPVALRVTAERNLRKKQLRDAERALANAATLAESAEEDETRLEDLVRDLEQRLVTTREELAAARLRSRRAEAAERKARQSLDRLRPRD